MTDEEALKLALMGDDILEDEGMHPDHRRTCWSCGTWADDSHTHDMFTGKVARA